MKLLCSLAVFLTVLVAPPLASIVAAQQISEEYIQTLIACGGDTRYIYLTPHGEKLVRRVRVLDSVEQVTATLERRVVEARQLIERGMIVDEAGHQMGERLVLLYSDKAVLLWSQGKRVEWVEAPSLESVIGYERWRSEMKKKYGVDG